MLARFKTAFRREQALARIDHLTGIANSRQFDHVLENILKRAVHDFQPITIAFIDLDHFKQINDLKAHRVGNKVLSIVAQTIRAHLRVQDVVGRVGGDEFACVMPGASEDDAVIIMTRIQQALKDKMQEHQWAVTFSAGVLCCNEIPRSADEALHQADDLMYHAKNNGRDRVSFGSYSPSAFPFLKSVRSSVGRIKRKNVNVI